MHWCPMWLNIFELFFFWLKKRNFSRTLRYTESETRFLGPRCQLIWQMTTQFCFLLHNYRGYAWQVANLRINEQDTAASQDITRANICWKYYRLNICCPTKGVGIYIYIYIYVCVCVCVCVCVYFFFLWRCDPTRVMASSFLRFSRSHTMTHHSR
jgi:hypothetical protein